MFMVVTVIAAIPDSWKPPVFGQGLLTLPREEAAK